jgi:acyl-CoA reductase-like NAD-dependent aldehyde dehydrogenase
MCLTCPLLLSSHPGTIWTNCWNVFDAALPFGGYKRSGIGRDKGEAALAHYVETKTVVTRMRPGSPWL